MDEARLGGVAHPRPRLSCGCHGAVFAAPACAREWIRVPGLSRLSTALLSALPGGRLSQWIALPLNCGLCIPVPGMTRDSAATFLGVVRTRLRRHPFAAPDSTASLPSPTPASAAYPFHPNPPLLLSFPLPYHSIPSAPLPSLPPPPFSPSLPYSTHLNPHLGTHLPHPISSPLLPLNHLFFAIPIPPLLPHFLLLPPSPAHISPAHRTPPNAPNCPVLPPPLPTSAFPPPPAPHMTGTVVEVASPGHGRR